MAKQKKILDVNTTSAHLVCIQHLDRNDFNPYRIYLVTSVPGTPVRKRLLDRYADLPSALCFIKDFYLEGMDTMCYTDIVDRIKSC